MPLASLPDPDAEAELRTRMADLRIVIVDLEALLANARAVYESLYAIEIQPNETLPNDPATGRPVTHARRQEIMDAREADYHQVLKRRPPLPPPEEYETPAPPRESVEAVEPA